MDILLNYITYLVITYLIMAVIIILGFPFKRWVKAQSGVIRDICTPILYIVIVVGYIVDVTLNVLITPIFLELPREMTVTQRMTRYKREEVGFKNSAAHWLCNMVNKHDPGHC